jgi:hypothetical protein
LLRDRPNGARGQRRRQNVAHFAASQSLRTTLQRHTRRLEYASRPRFYIKGGLGAISSSRCQTAHACQANLGRSWILITSGRAKRVAASARRFVVRKRSSFAGGSDNNFVGPEILRRNLSRNGCRTENCRNRPPSACQKTGPSGRPPRPTIGSRPPVWWSQTGSNRRPPACKAGALPTELWPLRGSVITRQ